MLWIIRLRNSSDFDKKSKLTLVRAIFKFIVENCKPNKVRFIFEILQFRISFISILQVIFNY